MIDTKLRRYVQPTFDKVAQTLHHTGFSADSVTIVAFLTGVLSGYLVSRQWMVPALMFLWLSGLLDVLDGTVARISGKTSSTGAFLDLILDRMVEAAVILGFYALAPEHALAHLLFFVGVIFNFSTFLAAGSLFRNSGVKSMHYDPGILERTETFLLFTAMILWPAARYWLLMLFNATMFLTGIIRFIRIIKLEKEAEKSSEE